MKENIVPVKKETFNSKLLPVIAVTFVLAAICGCISVGCFFHPSSYTAIKNDLIAGKIYDPSAIQTWTAVYIIFTVINCLTALVLGISMTLVITGRSYKGLDLISTGSKVALYGLNISGVCILVYFIYRAIRYIILCFKDIEAMFMPLISFVFIEGIMLTLTCIIFLKMRQFLESCTVSTASICYMLYSEKIDSPTLPPLSVTGFLIFSIVDFVMALDRFFSFSYTQLRTEVVYNIPFTTDAVHIISGLSFIFAAIGSLFLFIYLKSYKRKCEFLLFRSIKEVLN